MEGHFEFDAHELVLDFGGGCKVGGWGDEVEGSFEALIGGDEVPGEVRATLSDEAFTLGY